MQAWEDSLRRAQQASRKLAQDEQPARDDGVRKRVFSLVATNDEQDRSSEPGGAQSSGALSVSAAMALAKGALEGIKIRVIGEVSEFNNKSGYKAVYFTLKDEAASLPCMMWKNRFNACDVDIEVGSMVEVIGRFTLYAAKGRMNFDAFSIELAGEGKLRMQVARLAKKLEAEGLTSSTRKRPLPAYPQSIGLVTSPRGAAVHDVLRTLRRRWPLAQVLVAGVAVEGAKAPALLSEGISQVANAGAEVVLLVRGGGSFEDLLPFSDEGLARAIVACPVPVVTGIGHEPDTSIADLVADFRASTPTGAAEAASPDASELTCGLKSRMIGCGARLESRISSSRRIIDAYADRPVFADPRSLFAGDAQNIDFLQERLNRALPTSLERDKTKIDTLEARLCTQSANITAQAKAKLSTHAARLHDLSPLSVLGRGYAIARTQSGALLKSIAQAHPSKGVSIQVADGRIHCTVNETEAVSLSSGETERNER